MFATQLHITAPPPKQTVGRAISTSAAYRAWLDGASLTALDQHPARFSGPVSVTVALGEQPEDSTHTINAIVDVLARVGVIAGAGDVSLVHVGWNSTVEPGLARITVRRIISKRQHTEADQYAAH